MFLYWSSAQFSTRNFVIAPVSKFDLISDSTKIKHFQKRHYLWKQKIKNKNILNSFLFYVVYFDQHVIGISQCHHKGWRGDPHSGHTRIYHWPSARRFEWCQYKYYGNTFLLFKIRIAFYLVFILLAWNTTTSENVM